MNTDQSSASLHPRDLIDAVELPYGKARLPDDAKRPGPAKLILGGNLAGEVIYWLTMPAHSVGLARKCEDNVQLGATCVLLALRACQLKSGRLPESLSALTLPGSSVRRGWRASWPARSGRRR